MAFAAIGCTNTANTENSNTVENSVVDTENTEDTENTQETSLETEVESKSEADAKATIVLSDEGINIDGDGAAANDSTLTINSGGTYTISGSLSAGQIIVNAPSTDTVNLILNGVDITAQENAAIYASQAAELILTLSENTENKLEDATDFTYANK